MNLQRGVQTFFILMIFCIGLLTTNACADTGLNITNQTTLVPLLTQNPVGLPVTTLMTTPPPSVSVEHVPAELTGGTCSGAPSGNGGQCSGSPPLYPLMHPSEAQLDTEEAQYQSLEKYNAPRPKGFTTEGGSVSKSLLPYISYVPAERNQGSCGDCWVWASTGLLEIEHAVNTGVNERLSTQYFNSKYNNGQGPNFACCGGNIQIFSSWYATDKSPIPWSNTNAAFGDRNRYCGNTLGYNLTAVPIGTISTTPHYQLDSVSYLPISTTGVGQSAAIANIKSAIDNNKAVYYGFYYNDTGWNAFFSFWGSQAESVIFNPDSYGGPGNTGGHGVTIVGYDTTDPGNPYWVVLNSWGAPSGRPNGLFRLKMNMNYDSTYAPGWYQHKFYVMNANFNTSHIPVADFGVNTSEGTSPVTVQFTDLTTNIPTSWNWTFGDGNWTGSTLENPVHTYLTKGNFTVSLNASNSWGSNISTKVRYVNVTVIPPIADFHGLRTTGVAPVTIRFVDSSRNAPATWNWSFGEGIANSTVQNPVHTYLVPGTYTVSLNVTNSAGFDNLTRIGYVTVTNTTDKVGGYLNGAWNLDRNENVFWDGILNDGQYTWGWSAATPVVGDWNGDGKTEIGVCYSGQWWLDYNGNGVWDGPSVDKYYTFGSPGSMLIIGDWNGDGKTEIGTYNAGTWQLDYNGNGVWDGPVTDRQYTWGWSASTPVIGDWNGDGATKIGVYYSGQWWLDYNGNGVWDPAVDKQHIWGWSDSTPIIGDWNRDGTRKIGVYDSGQWRLDYNGNGVWDGPVIDRVYTWGWSAAMPVVGDWNGDGTTKIGVYYNGQWWLDHNGNGVWDGSPGDQYGSIGSSGWIPLIGKWG